MDSRQSSQLAISYDIPEEALIKEYEATSTYTNATTTIDITERLNMGSALIVTSDFHIKRSKFIYNRLNDRSFDFKYISALTPDGLTWNERSNAKLIWYSEFKKSGDIYLDCKKIIDKTDNNENI